VSVSFGFSSRSVCVLAESKHNEVAAPMGVRRVAVATSMGIRQLVHIDKFLDVDAVVSPGSVSETDHVESVVVWGRKETAAPALDYASEHGLNVLYLEDGWVRSASSNAHNRRTYSMLIDKVGVYYDASTPSELELTLNASAEEFAQLCTPQQLSYASDCRSILVDSDITKYNYCKTAVLPENDRPLVLVIDQTLDDASVRLGGADANRFHQMLLAAIDENPDADIVVRTHPDVVAGRKRGYLTALASELGVSISANGDNPMPWLKRCERCYVATSQIGYEALLCGASVTVFGKPFYAGWGLTDDRQVMQHRTASRTLDELFFAAHVLLARYINPINGDAWELHECLEHVQLQRRYFRKNAKPFYCAGITAWKRGYIRQYLRSPDGSVSFTAPDASVKNPVHATWSFRHFNSESPRSPQGQVQELVRIEDGFLRSAGLGSDFTAPGSLVVDATGLYFDPSQTSDLERLLNEADVTPSDVRRAARLRNRILKAGLSKYNVGHNANNFAKSAVTKCVLVVGQVEDDASIQRGCADIADNAALLRAVREAEPDAYVDLFDHCRRVGLV